MAALGRTPPANVARYTYALDDQGYFIMDARNVPLRVVVRKGVSFRPGKGSDGQYVIKDGTRVHGQIASERPSADGASSGGAMADPTDNPLSGPLSYAVPPPPLQQLGEPNRSLIAAAVDRSHILANSPHDSRQNSPDSSPSRHSSPAAPATGLAAAANPGDPALTAHAFFQNELDKRDAAHRLLLDSVDQEHARAMHEREAEVRVLRDEHRTRSLHQDALEIERDRLLNEQQQFLAERAQWEANNRRLADQLLAEQSARAQQQQAFQQPLPPPPSQQPSQRQQPLTAAPLPPQQNASLLDLSSEAPLANNLVAPPGQDARVGGTSQSSTLLSRDALPFHPQAPSSRPPPDVPQRPSQAELAAYGAQLQQLHDTLNHLRDLDGNPLFVDQFPLMKERLRKEIRAYRRRMEKTLRQSVRSSAPNLPLRDSMTTGEIYQTYVSMIQIERGHTDARGDPSLVVAGFLNNVGEMEEQWRTYLTVGGQTRPPPLAPPVETVGLVAPVAGLSTQQAMQLLSLQQTAAQHSAPTPVASGGGQASSGANEPPSQLPSFPASEPYRRLQGPDGRWYTVQLESTVTGAIGAQQPVSMVTSGDGNRPSATQNPVSMVTSGDGNRLSAAQMPVSMVTNPVSMVTSVGGDRPPGAQRNESVVTSAVGGWPSGAQQSESIVTSAVGSWPSGAQQFVDVRQVRVDASTASSAAGHGPVGAQFPPYGQMASSVQPVLQSAAGPGLVTTRCQFEELRGGADAWPRPAEHVLWQSDGRESQGAGSTAAPVREQSGVAYGQSNVPSTGANQPYLVAYPSGVVMQTAPQYPSQPSGPLPSVNFPSQSYPSSNGQVVNGGAPSAPSQQFLPVNGGVVYTSAPAQQNAPTSSVDPYAALRHIAPATAGNFSLPQQPYVPMNGGGGQQPPVQNVPFPGGAQSVAPPTYPQGGHFPPPSNFPQSNAPPSGVNVDVHAPPPPRAPPIDANFQAALDAQHARNYERGLVDAYGLMSTRTNYCAPPPQPPQQPPPPVMSGGPAPFFYPPPPLNFPPPNNQPLVYGATAPPVAGYAPVQYPPDQPQTPYNNLLDMAWGTAQPARPFSARCLTANGRTEDAVAFTRFEGNGGVNEDFDTWMKDTIFNMRTSNLPPAQYAVTASSCLRGIAKHKFQEVAERNHAVLTDFNEFCREMRALFHNPMAGQSRRSQFRALIQKEGQRVSSYAFELERLAVLAFPSPQYTEQLRDDMMREQTYTGILPHLASAIMGHQFNNFRDLLHALTGVEARMEATGLLTAKSSLSTSAAKPRLRQLTTPQLQARQSNGRFAGEPRVTFNHTSNTVAGVSSGTPPRKRADDDDSSDSDVDDEHTLVAAVTSAPTKDPSTRSKAALYTGLHDPRQDEKKKGEEVPSLPPNFFALVQQMAEFATYLKKKEEEKEAAAKSQPAAQSPRGSAQPPSTPPRPTTGNNNANGNSDQRSPARPRGGDCYNCGKPGHFSRECTETRRPRYTDNRQQQSGRSQATGANAVELGAGLSGEQREGFLLGCFQQGLAALSQELKSTNERMAALTSAAPPSTTSSAAPAAAAAAPASVGAAHVSDSARSAAPPPPVHVYLPQAGGSFYSTHNAVHSLGYTAGLTKGAGNPAFGFDHEANEQAIEDLNNQLIAAGYPPEPPLPPIISAPNHVHPITAPIEDEEILADNDVALAHLLYALDKSGAMSTVESEQLVQELSDELSEADEQLGQEEFERMVKCFGDERPDEPPDTPPVAPLDEARAEPLDTSFANSTDDSFAEPLNQLLDEPPDEPSVRLLMAHMLNVVAADADERPAASSAFDAPPNPPSIDPSTPDASLIPSSPEASAPASLVPSAAEPFAHPIDHSPPSDEAALIQDVEMLVASLLDTVSLQQEVATSIAEERPPILPPPQSHFYLYPGEAYYSTMSSAFAKMNIKERKWSRSKAPPSVPPDKLRSCQISPQGPVAAAIAAAMEDDPAVELDTENMSPEEIRREVHWRKLARYDGRRHVLTPPPPFAEDPPDRLVLATKFHLRCSEIPTTINGEQAKALLDSGAEYSIMPLGYARLLGVEIQELDPEIHLCLRNVSGDEMAIVGLADIPMQIGSYSFVHQFLIVVDAGSSRSCILGSDFFDYAFPEFHYHQGYCKVFGQKVPVGGLTRLKLATPTGATSTDAFEARLEKKIRIRPRSQVVVAARVRTCLKGEAALLPEDHRPYVDPKPFLSAKTLIVEPPERLETPTKETTNRPTTGTCLTMIDSEDLVNVLLLNPLNRRVILKPGYLVGSVQVLDDDGEEILGLFARPDITLTKPCGTKSGVTGPSPCAVNCDTCATAVYTSVNDDADLDILIGAAAADVVVQPPFDPPDESLEDEQPDEATAQGLLRFAVPTLPPDDKDPSTWTPSERRAKLDALITIDNDQLSEEDKAQLRELVLTYADVFSLHELDMGQCGLFKHTIKTGDTPPVGQRPFRIPGHLREEFRRQMQILQKAGTIIDSTSPWASPVVIVPKKDGSVRVCIDFRRLNAVTERDVYPLPRIEELLDAIGKARYFSSIDLAQGFLQIEIDEKDQSKTAFTSFLGLHQYTRMPFGLTNAPATFQRLMEVVLAGLHWVQCLVYIDDILVFSPTFDQHLLDVHAVLKRLRKHNLRAKPSKCHFGAREVEFLGHIVSHEGLRPDPKKLRAVSEFPRPQDQRELRSFIGLMNYYRRFVNSFATVAAPLYELMKAKVDYVWSPRCQEAFESLKADLLKAPTLSFPDFTKEFILTTDASKYGIGAILSQLDDTGLERPLSFWSRRLRVPEVNWNSTIEWEALAIVWAIEQNRAYLQGRHFTIITDHAPLKWLMTHKDANARLMKWALRLQGYHFTIVHKPGASNVNADALSRAPVAEIDGVEVMCNASALEAAHSQPFYDKFGLDAPETCALCAVLLRPQQREPDTLEVDRKYSLDPTAFPTTSTYDGFNFSLIRSQQLHDAEIKQIYSTTDWYQQHNAPLPADLAHLSRFVVENGVFFRRGNASHPEKRVYVPALWRRELLQAYHSDRLGAHLGVEKVTKRLERRYYWPSLVRDVEEFVTTCNICQTFKRGGSIRKVPLTPLLAPGEPFSRIACDALTLTTTTSGNCYAVVFKCYLTKWPEVYAVPDITATTIADCLVDVISRHGCPRELLTDRGSYFTSALFTSVCKRLGIRNIYTTPYHPMTDGMVEVFNRTLVQMLRAYVAETQRDWDEILPLVLAAYRAAIHSTTGDSPFHMLYGRDMTMPIDLILSPPPGYTGDLAAYKEELFERVRLAWRYAIGLVERAQASYKATYDRSAAEATYRVADLVLVKVHQVSKGRMRKLGPLWRGPFRVIALEPSTALLASVGNPNATPRWHSLNNLKPYKSATAMPQPSALKVPRDPYLTHTVDGQMNDGEPPVQTLPEVKLPSRGRPSTAQRVDVTSLPSASSATTPPPPIILTKNPFATDNLNSLPTSSEHDDAVADSVEQNDSADDLEGAGDAADAPAQPSFADAAARPKKETRRARQQRLAAGGDQITPQPRVSARLAEKRVRRHSFSSFGAHLDRAQLNLQTADDDSE